MKGALANALKTELTKEDKERIANFCIHFDRKFDERNWSGTRTGNTSDVNLTDIPETPSLISIDIMLIS